MMASAITSTRAKASAKATVIPLKPSPLIPEQKRYVYKPSAMTASVQDVVKFAQSNGVKIDVPQTPYATTKLVQTLCSVKESGLWNRNCERALIEHLPLREHHAAFLSHNMFVTMIGVVVARAIEQATSGWEDTLDLLANRYYVRSIACHDSSKTSAMEAVAYSGIMAVHIEKDNLVDKVKKQTLINKRYGGGQTEEEKKASTLEKFYTDPNTLTTPMANFGFKHHYENNPHHPEHFTNGEIPDINLVEAIVDGLACIFERNKTHTDVNSWLNIYYVDRFTGHNKDLAQYIIEALKNYITNADYKALETFRMSIFSIIEEHIPFTVCRNCNPDKAKKKILI